MKHIKIQFNFKSVAIITLLPLLGAGIFILIGTVQGIPALRYDPAYFSAEHAATYDSPREVLFGLEEVFKTGDRQLLAEVEGLRRPRSVARNPRLFGALMWERDEHYFSYMYWDSETWDRYLVHTEQRDGRWIVVPEDAFFFLRTGLWLRAWLPIAVVYYIAEVVGLFIWALTTRAERWRRQWYAIDKNSV